MHKHGVCPKSIGQFVIFQPFSSKLIQIYGTCSNTLVFQTNQVCWSILSMTTEYQPNWSLGKTPSVEPALQCQRENKTGHSRCQFDLDFDRCGTFCWKTTVLFTLSRQKFESNHSFLFRRTSVGTLHSMFIGGTMSTYFPVWVASCLIPFVWKKQIHTENCVNPIVVCGHPWLGILKKRVTTNPMDSWPSSKDWVHPISDSWLYHHMETTYPHEFSIESLCSMVDSKLT
jgi:hypothetical protein